ncbi:MAG: EAL domain-containing protein [Coprobacillus cateniformis]
MKKTLSKVGAILVPVILCTSLAFTAFLSIQLIDDLQGNARVVNYIGIVRGATQRLVKKELNHEPDDNLIKHLDKILDGLSNGSDEFDLIKLESQQFQSLLVEMKNDWNHLKTEIHKYRSGLDNQTLFEMSEDYFELADNTVLVAENYIEERVQSARNLLLIMNSVFIVMAGGCTIFTYYQQRRQQRIIEIENENIRKSEQLARRAQQLLAPMNEISEMMYVSDIDTYELLFINDAGKRIFQVDDTQKSLKCYKVIQGFDEPCPFCTSSLLKMDETHSWEYTNPLLKKHYLLKDRLIEWDGRIARMEIAFDITEANNEKKELKQRLKRDNIRLECIRELYHNRDINMAMSNILKQIGELFLADRAYILLFHNNHFSNLAEWCREGVEPQIDSLQDIPLTGYEVWVSELEEHKDIVIDDIRELKNKLPSGYDFLAQQGIRNLTWVPLEKDGHLNGCIGLDNQPLNMSKMAVPFLRTVQYFIALTMERNENEKTLFELSHLDKLTSFYNRNCFIQDVADMSHQHESVGVIYLDVNGLKETNDNFGHDAGDKLLKACAEIIKRSSTSKYLYRIGGDEFVVIYMKISKEEFEYNVQKMKNNFMSSQCRVAIGVQWTKDSQDIQNIIKRADELMYSNKQEYYSTHKTTGRYRHDKTLQYLSNPDILDLKISQGQFHVYLQAKIDVKSCELVGADALIKYKDDSQFIQSPDKFISILEDSHQIDKIDFFVFEKICQQLQEWKNANKKLFPISSHFSRSTFMKYDFLERLETKVELYDVHKKYLEVEITENMFTTNYKEVKERITQIRSAGFIVSVDDFGIESSNLALLATAQFDILKIDKSFISDVVSNKNTRTVIESMVDVCTKMNIKLIAEGVENKEQLNVLKECGIRTVQGFLFSKPIPMIEYEWKYMK